MSVKSKAKLSLKGPVEISAKDAGELLGISDRRVRELVADGHIQKGDNDKYEVKLLVHGYVAFLKDTERNSTQAASEATLKNMRAKKLEMEMRKRLPKVRITDILMDVNAATGFTHLRANVSDKIKKCC